MWVHINCWGGTVYDALAAVDVMVASPTPIVTIIEGMAASAATMLSIAGDRRLIRPSGVMLIHQLRGGDYGKKCDVEDEMENLEKLEDRLVEYYVANTKIRESKFRKMMGRELEYSAETCLKLGLVDEIYKGEEILGKRKRKR
jgi:ATP-dependent Clp protease protease subunit